MGRGVTATGQVTLAPPGAPQTYYILPITYYLHARQAVRQPAFAVAQAPDRRMRRHQRLLFRRERRLRRGCVDRAVQQRNPTVTRGTQQPDHVTDLLPDDRCPLRRQSALNTPSIAPRTSRSVSVVIPAGARRAAASAGTAAALPRNAPHTAVEIDAAAPPAPAHRRNDPSPARDPDPRLRAPPPRQRRAIRIAAKLTANGCQ